MWQYAHLRYEHRQRVEDVVHHMVENRHWTGGGGFEVTDEMRVVVAGHAALMTLGLDEPYYFHRVPDIILYPKPFFVTRQQAMSWSTHPVFGTAVDSPRLGEAWQHGPIVLSWDRIFDPYDNDGRHVNVVIHEFTHHLDGLDGDTSGTPPMSDLELERDWYRVTELDYLELCGQAERHEATLLSHYGATNRAEFFAVSTECFFDRPHDLRDEHPHLYEVLAKYFRQSPANYLPRSAQPPLLRAGWSRHAGRGRSQLSAAVASDPFSRGLAQLRDGRLHDAVRSLSEAIALDADDSEAFAARGSAWFALGELDRALSDAQRALELDPGDFEALTVRGAVQVLRNQLPAGIADLRTVCADRGTPRAHAHLGLAYLRQGAARRAVHQLTLAIDANPTDIEPYRWRAEAHRQLGREADAERDEQKAARLQPRTR